MPTIGGGTFHLTKRPATQAVRRSVAGGFARASVCLFARSDRLRFDADVLRDSPQDGLRLYLSRGLPPLTLHVQKLWWSKRHTLWPDDPTTHKTQNIGEWYALPLDALAAHTPAGMTPGFVQNVSPWGPWWDDTHMPVVRLGIGDLARELHVARRDPGAWVQPAPRGTFRGGAALEYKMLAIRRGADGDVYVDVNLAAGEAGGMRRFDIADSEYTERVGWRHRRDRSQRAGNRVGSQVIPYVESLAELQDYVLQWPREVAHPRLFVDRSELQTIREAGLQSPRLKTAWLALKPAHLSEETWMEGPLAEGVRGHFGWAEQLGDHPHGSDAARVAVYLLTGDPEAARMMRLPETLERHLGLLGDYDKMRVTQLVAGLYDALVDSDLVTPQRRRVLNAQMAHLGYQLAHPATWSVERGFNSGNLNMTVSYLLGLGTVACAIPDHPQARQWAQPALDMMEQMLDETGPAGEWPESSGYAHVTATHLLAFAVAATRAGFRDYVNDARLKRLILWLAKCYTPPDPRAPEGRAGLRRLIAFGRAGGGGLSSVQGVMARATAESDPGYSSALQHIWLGMGAPVDRFAWHLGGFEYVYLDPTLPAEAPDWTADVFPRMGMTLRHGMGGRYEHYAALISGDSSHMIYGSQTGALVSLFAYGAPLGGSFWGSYQDQEEFLVNRVSLARAPGTVEDRRARFGCLGGPVSGMFFRPQLTARFGERDGEGNVSAFSTLPRQDYAAVDVAMVRRQALSMDVREDLPWPPLMAGEGQLPLHWRRQVLFLKDEDPTAPAYLLVRDTVRGGGSTALTAGQPTMWTFWTQSEKLGAAGEAADRDAFLADRPGETNVAPRPLQGDRFTAVGRWGVDLEFYVAEPRDTPRHTLRWGTRYGYHPLYRFQEFQDLLHLQREDDGTYYVALYPRRAEGEVPRFAAQGGGHIIRVQGAFGVDWGFLSAVPVESEEDDVAFSGTAASVQQRNGETVLSLGAAGSARFRETALRGSGAASLNVSQEAAVLRLPPDHGGTEVVLQLPGRFEVQSEDVSGQSSAEGRLSIDVPSDVQRIDLRRERGMPSGTR